MRKSRSLAAWQDRRRAENLSQQLHHLGIKYQVAMTTLKQIATMPRKTRARRLAEASIGFITLTLGEDSVGRGLESANAGGVSFPKSSSGTAEQSTPLGKQNQNL